MQLLSTKKNGGKQVLGDLMAGSMEFGSNETPAEMIESINQPLHIVY